MLSYIAFILCPKHAMVKLLKVILSSSVASCSHKISGITCCLFQENLIVSLWKVFFFVVLFNNLVSLDHLLKFRFSLAYIYTWIPHNPTCNFPIYSYEPFLSCYKNFEFLWNSHDYLFIFGGRGGMEEWEGSSFYLKASQMLFIYLVIFHVDWEGNFQKCSGH